jgi:ABC-type lipoprotein export system ATPase subunit
MMQLNEAGNTIVLITHDLQIAANARRVISIRDGNIVSDERNSPPPAAVPARQEVVIA